MTSATLLSSPCVMTQLAPRPRQLPPLAPPTPNSTSSLTPATTLNPPSVHPHPPSSIPTAITPTSARKRPRSARRPPPIAIPQRPPTSLPTSFYSHSGSPTQDIDVGVWQGDQSSAAASRKGARRKRNEDRVFANPAARIYGVCDGHGGESHVGATASERVAHVLPKLLAQGCPVKDAFERVDRIVCDMFTTKCCVGTTVALVHIKRRRTLSVAHVGDSRVMLIDADGSAITLTEDHSPNRPDELARIEREGGGVIHGRVNGVLAVSRAVGDTALKNVVPALPEESEYHLGRNDQLIVLATDGLWDMVSAKEVASFLKSLPLAPGSTSVPLDLAKAAEALVDKAVSRGSRDDTSVVLVDIRNV